MITDGVATLPPTRIGCIAGVSGAVAPVAGDAGGDKTAFYRGLQSQVASLKHSLDLSEESLKLTVLRYTAGEVTILEVVDAQTTLIAARNAYDDGLSRYRLSLATLQTLTGAF